MSTSLTMVTVGASTGRKLSKAIQIQGQSYCHRNSFHPLVGSQVDVLQVLHPLKKNFHLCAGATTDAHTQAVRCASTSKERQTIQNPLSRRTRASMTMKFQLPETPEAQALALVARHQLHRRLISFTGVQNRHKADCPSLVVSLLMAQLVGPVWQMPSPLECCHTA